MPRANAPAATLGLRSGDRIAAVAGTPVEDWSDLAAAYAAAGARGVVALELAAEVEPEEGAEPAPTRRLEVPALGSLEALGVVPASVLISDVTARLGRGRGRASSPAT